MILNIDFNSKDNEYLFNPKIDTSILKDHLKKRDLDSHIFILSSGTTQSSGLKGYALSKDAILANAKAVNNHLGIQSSDNWLCSLPYYHIGGLSIYARASLLGNEVLEYMQKWDPEEFDQRLSDIQYVSVVPLQCHDIAKANLEAPKNLKGLIVGGDYLPNSIHKKLMELNWPVLRTFGMTEVSSQLATEKVPSEKLSLEVLDIHNIEIKNEKMFVTSPALFSGVFEFNNGSFNYKKREDIFSPSDRVKIENGFIYPLGRSDSILKIKGRRVDTAEVNRIFIELSAKYDLYESVQLIFKSHERLGQEIILKHTFDNVLDQFINEFNSLILPLEVNKVIKTDNIHRTELGKIKNTD